MKNRNIVRFLALLLVILLAGGAVVSALISALAEEAAPARDRCEAAVEYMEDEQALRVTQRLFYHNPSDGALDRVVFYAMGNLFRRESALFYENDVLLSVFPAGYAPAGMELRSVKCDGQDADWGFQGESETALRVSCNLPAGGECTFEFEYYLLLSENRAFLGTYETDVRLSAFLLTPGIYSEADGEFLINPPLQHTRWLDGAKADYSVTLRLPETYLPAGTGEKTLLSTENGVSVWQIDAQNAQEFALSFGRRWRETTAESASGVRIRVLSNARGAAREALDYAVKIVDLYEQWLGDFPVRTLDVVQSDYPVDALSFTGAVWLPEKCFGDAAAMRRALRFAVAQQYFGLSAHPASVSDAWLADVPCSYLSLLAVEELEGCDAFVAALNDQVLDALNITIPGGLYISADASLFTAEEYALIVRDRGAVVMHETRVAMGRDAMLASLRRFYEIGQEKDVLGEYDLIAAFDEATGGDWEAFFTDWLFNVGDYVEQQLDHYE